jgi:hypothetical protein
VVRYVGYAIAAVTVLMAGFALWRIWRDPEIEALQAEHRTLSRTNHDLIALWRHRAEVDDEMAVAHAARVEPAAADWDLWEEQFYSLTPLVDRVARIREGRR